MSKIKNNIKLAAGAGFCIGVKYAVNKAQEAADIGNVYCLGDLIHNARINSGLKDKGLKFVNSIDEIPNGANVIIRSHGAPKSIFDFLNEKKCKIIDCTCEFVKKIHKIVKEHYDNGYKIIIIGEPSHAEVVGIGGWCDNNAIVVNCVEDILIDNNYKYCIVAQTTFNTEKYAEIEDYIKNNIKSFAIFNTICYTTKHRQSEASKLAAQSDYMIVIGDKKSANTVRLYEICLEKCAQTFLVESIDNLDNISIDRNKIIGITAGASTPKELIEEVVNHMSDTQEKVVKNEKVENSKPSFAELLNNSASKDPKAGKTITGKIVKADEQGITVAMPGYKKDGFIDKELASMGNYNPADFKAGSDITAKIVDNNGKNKEYIALDSKCIAEKAFEDEKVKEILNSNEFKFTFHRKIEGSGLIANVGSYSIFVPASQIIIGFVKDEKLDSFFGKELRLRVMPPKKVIEIPEDATEEEKAKLEKKKEREAKKIYASQRVILEEEAIAKDNEFWSSMVVNDVYSGKVVRITPFGAFVNINGRDCLVHISEISWNKITDPATVLKVGQTYDFLCLKVDRENDRVSLSYKQLQKTPYELAAEKYTVGSVIKGKVARLVPFGAFVSIEDGIDGLVHVSNICHEWVKNPNEKLKVGDEVEAKIIGFEGNKITLSIKDLLPEPEEVVAEEVAEDLASEAKASKSKKTDKKVREKKPKKEDESGDNLKEWVSDSTTTSLADLFKDIDLKK